MLPTSPEGTNASGASSISISLDDVSSKEEHIVEYTKSAPTSRSNPDRKDDMHAEWLANECSHGLQIKDRWDGESVKTIRLSLT